VATVQLDERGVMFVMLRTSRDPLRSFVRTDIENGEVVEKDGRRARCPLQRYTPCKQVGDRLPRRQVRVGCDTRTGSFQQLQRLRSRQKRSRGTKGDRGHCQAESLTTPALLNPSRHARRTEGIGVAIRVEWRLGGGG
jgi:hypothetical protein